MNITEQLQKNIDEASAKGLYDLYTIYGVKEPLLDAIEAGEVFLWRSELVRSLIVSEMKREKRSDGRPLSLSAEQRNFKLLCELHYLSGRGVIVYSSSKRPGQTACEILSEKYHLSPGAIEKIWKNRKPHPLYDAAYKAGEKTQGD